MISAYKDYKPHQVEELLSNFLINRWSYSGVNTFTRNEKDFERRYIYNEWSKSSATAIAGQAYHAALEHYFRSLHSAGVEPDIIDLQKVGYEYIESIPDDQWKIQKTRPTVEACINAANQNALRAITNFMKERSVYTDYIKNIVGVELSLTEWIVINGVSIPLPAKGRIDLVVETNDDKLAIVDHKSKAAFTPEEDLSFVSGKQSIIYTKLFESKYGRKIDEVLFVENKISANRNGAPQLKPTKMVMDDSTRRLYEAILYEPLKRMIEAVSDPDHIYLINDHDNFVSMAEMYDFWAKVMLEEVEGFNIDPSKKELIKKRQRKIKDSSINTVTPTVLKNFKKHTEAFIPFDYANKDMTMQEKIESRLRNFGLSVNVAHVFEGFSSDTLLLDVGVGVAINSVKRHRMDIANALGVPSVRISEHLTVYNDKSYLTIEAGKRNTETLMWDEKDLVGRKIPIGVDNFKNTVYWDLDNHSTPHMLVCGATGSGKSVSLKSTIMYAIAAGVDDIMIFDPKYEFRDIKSDKVSVLNDIDEIEHHIALLVEEMEERVRSGRDDKKLIVFDEFADAIMNARTSRQLKEGELTLDENLRKILQKGRSTGMRVIVATQRADVKVIAGNLKVNLPVQVCFRVPKAVDSNVVIDEDGGETLMGRGDGLIKSPEYLHVQRFQGYYYE